MRFEDGNIGTKWPVDMPPPGEIRSFDVPVGDPIRAADSSPASTLVEWLDNGCPKTVVSFVRRDGKGDELLFVANLSAAAVRVSVETRGAYELAPWEFRFVGE